VPEAPRVIAIQLAPEVAVHAQVVADAVTVTAPSPWSCSNCLLVGAIVNVQAGGGGGGGGGAAACATVNVCPAAVSLVARAAPVFAATLYSTVPLPVPDAPALIVIHGTLDAAVQAQAGPAVTATVAVAPAAPTEAVVGASENAHGAAACTIV